MSDPQPVVPDYSGANLTGLVPGLLAAPGKRPGWLPPAALEAEQVVLLVLDGLGWDQFRERLDLAPALASMDGRAITSVAPSTTACALTSLVVGAPPASHGVVGYRVVVDGPEGPEVMNVLKWRGTSGDARPFVDPAGFQVLTPFLGNLVPVVSKAEFAGTAFTEAHQRGARQVAWYQASGLAVEVKRLVALGEKFVYAYYDGIDRIAHVQGFGPFYDAELIAVDRIVADLLESLPAGAALVVTADHGQVDVGPNVVDLDEAILGEVAIVSGEARFRWLHASDRSAAGVARLADRARSLYGKQSWVATFDQIEAEGWLGGPLSDRFRQRLGDVALVPFEPVGYLGPGEGKDAKLVCRHGSLTEAEMFVPLVGTAGRGGRLGG